MSITTFKDWTLTKLDKAFGLHQIFIEESALMQEWIARAQQQVLSDFEQQTLRSLQVPLQMGGKSWNKTKLESKFISQPLNDDGTAQ